MDPPTLQARIAKSFPSNITCLMVSFALQFIGCVTPGWFPDAGLWSAGGSIYLLETSLALAFLVIALVLCGFMRFGTCIQTQNRHAFIYFICLSTLLSGVLAMTAAGKVGSLYINDYKGSYVPYSVILTGLGGIIAGLFSIVILVSLKPCKTDPLPPPMYEMSAQPAPYEIIAQPATYEMPTQPAVVTNAGQRRPGYWNEDLLAAAYDHQQIRGYINDRQPSAAYAYQQNRGYINDGQPSAAYAYQQTHGYINEGQPSAAYAYKQTHGYINEGQPSAAYAYQQTHGYINEGMLSAEYADQPNPDNSIYYMPLSDIGYFPLYS